MAAGDSLRKYWPVVTAIVIIAVMSCAAILVLRTMPPSTIAMATGPEGSAYYEVGKRYRVELAKAGVEVRLVSTGGSPENLALLLDPRSGVSVSLIRGGTAGAIASHELESLGAVAYQPLWLFQRRGLAAARGLLDLRGRKISVGPVGSGTWELSLELLKRNGIDGRGSELLTLAPEAASEKLLAGESDAMLTLNAWEGPIVQKLLDERIEAASFERADAYVALYPFLNKVVVPRGAGDLEKDLPATDVVLLAPKTSLVVRKDLHSAIQYLRLNAAVQIHSAPGIFQRASQFPAAEAIDFPLSAEALQYYKSGRPFLHNYLPFWMVELVGKLVLVLIPVIGLLYPIMRFLPAAYDWLMRSKILRIYGELRLLDDEIVRTGTGTERDTGAMIAQLDQLEQEADNLRLPVAYASMRYFLRNHIDLVRAGRKRPCGSTEKIRRGYCRLLSGDKVDWCRHLSQVGRVGADPHEDRHDEADDACLVGIDCRRAGHSEPELRSIDVTGDNVGGARTQRRQSHHRVRFQARWSGLGQGRHGRFVRRRQGGRPEFDGAYHADHIPRG